MRCGANITYFLKAVVPEAEKAGVRLALHPNDPPAPISRGSQQIMGSIDGWKKLIAIVDSPANGITFDCGVTREMGGDPVEVCRYFASRDRINHVHFRNVKVQKPNERYTEVFIDEGENNMFAVMKELVKHKYSAADLSGASARHRLRSRTPELPLAVPGRRRLRRVRLQRRLHPRDDAGRLRHLGCRGSDVARFLDCQGAFA